MALKVMFSCSYKFADLCVGWALFCIQDVQMVECFGEKKLSIGIGYCFVLPFYGLEMVTLQCSNGIERVTSAFNVPMVLKWLTLSVMFQCSERVTFACNVPMVLKWLT